MNMRHDHSYVVQATVPRLTLWIAFALRIYQPTHGYSVYELVLSTEVSAAIVAHMPYRGVVMGTEGGGKKKNKNTVPIDLQNPWLPPVKHIQRDTVNLLRHLQYSTQALLTGSSTGLSVMQVSSNTACSTASVQTTTKHNNGIKYDAKSS